MSALAERSRLSAEMRIDELRRAIGTASDGTVRGRLRVELAGLLRAQPDLPAALAELRRAADEAPGSTVVRLALLSAATALPVAERAGFLAEVSLIARVEVPAWSAAAAEAQLEAGRPAQAARSWLALAADNRVPVHQRRAAARRATEIGASGLPREHLAALRMRAALSAGRTRLGFLRQALALVSAQPADQRVWIDVATAWLEAGGASARIEPLIEVAARAGAAPDEVARLRREIERRRPQSPAVLPALRSDRTPPPSAMAAGLMERALGAARAGRGVLARRLAEQALRSGDAGASPSRLAAVEAALRQGGLMKQALLLRRTQLEGEPAPNRDGALEALIDEAAAAGLSALAADWRADRARARPGERGATLESAPASPADYYLAAQRRLVRLPAGGDVGPVLSLLSRAVAGHAGADAALALGERLLRRATEAAPRATEARIVEMLRSAFLSEDLPSRRVRLANRLAVALEGDGDAAGALSVLDRAIAGLPLEAAATLRRRRARLLRELGRVRELASALAADADAFTGRERLAALAERAQLLDAAGEPERALAERLTALSEFPQESGNGAGARAAAPAGLVATAVAVLAPARRRLESTGRFEPSLRLATATVHHIPDRGERLKQLRDIAVLSEKANRGPHEVAAAWLAVLALDAEDVAAAEAAERVLMAAGEWERCADLLSWAAGRIGSEGGAATARRAPILWRLAELRRARLAQEDEALRLYRALGAPTTPVSALPAAPPGGAPIASMLRRRLQAGLALHNARVAVAPGAADKARALLDRGMFLLDQFGQPAEAEADVDAALDLDPRNVEVIGALERICASTQKWAELGHRLEQKAAGLAPAGAARLWYGVGRVAERRDEPAPARAAYERSMALDPALPEPVIALRKLATQRSDWSEVVRLLDLELGLIPPDGERTALLIELAGILGDKLGESGRALVLLERAEAAASTDPHALDLLFRFSLAGADRADRRWESAAQALERLLATGTEVSDAADRYFRVAAEAEAAGNLDQALIFFSRSYSRNSNHRPTLERLSFICFEKGQWDNAWRATEALIDRHRAGLGRGDLAELFVRSALCDVHIAQRLSALAQLSTMVGGGGGMRDLAETWAAMRIEPRLLSGVEGERRARVLDRLRDALAIEECPPPARRQAWEVRGALALVEQRWVDAREALELLASDDSASSVERCGYLLAAGDIAGNVQNDPEAAKRFYGRARAERASDPRLAGRGSSGAVPSANAHDNTDELTR
jgi:tetratricopeptide (TPR) repeat protein